MIRLSAYAWPKQSSRKRAGTSQGGSGFIFNVIKRRRWSETMLHREEILRYFFVCVALEGKDGRMKQFVGIPEGIWLRFPRTCENDI
jgi:hypothetical protein